MSVLCPLTVADLNTSINANTSLDLDSIFFYKGMDMQAKDIENLRVEDDTWWREANREVSADITFKLEERAKNGFAMQGFQLSRLDLRNIYLVNNNAKSGFNFEDSDFYRSDLESAHCFKVDFSGCSLMKANFKNANLHCANLEDCNLLGANFEQAKLEHVCWGDEILQEKMLKNASSPEEMDDLYQQTEEIYRHLRKVTEDQGLFDLSGQFFRKEMIARRKQLPFFSGPRLLSKIVDLFCGYGEEPLRIIAFTWFAIMMYAVVYLFAGLVYDEQIIQLDIAAGLDTNLYFFLDTLYFSIITFTTLGYGDITPKGFSRFVASTEALMGSFSLALFVVVFVKKMIR